MIKSVPFFIVKKGMTIYIKTACLFLHILHLYLNIILTVMKDANVKG